MKSLFKTLSALLMIPMALNSQSFDRTKIGSMVPASLIYPDGRTENVKMKLQVPELLKKLDNLLEIELNENNPILKEVNSSLGTTGGTGAIGRFQASLFNAFLIDGNIWAKRANPKAKPAYAQNFVVLTRQGGIQQYTCIDGEHKEGTVMLGTVKNNVVWKWGDKLPSNDYKTMLADCPVIAERLKTDRSNLDSVLTAYNIWYENINPGRIKYYFQEGPKQFATSFKAAETKDIRALMKESKAKKDSINAAKKEMLASRPSAAAPEIASQKPNLPPKKEVLSAKVKRFESEGNKIAVVIESQKTIVRNPTNSCLEGAKEIPFEDGEYLNRITAKLNELYQTTIFEAVALEKVPVKTVKSFMIDNWWDTKYKVVVSLNQTRAYGINKTGVVTDVQYFINNVALVTEYINDEKLSTDYLKRNYNMGNGYSNTKIYQDCGSIEKFNGLIDFAITNERFDKNETERLTKLVEKWD